MSAVGSAPPPSQKTPQARKALAATFNQLSLLFSVYVSERELPFCKLVHLWILHAGHFATFLRRRCLKVITAVAR